MITVLIVSLYIKKSKMKKIFTIWILIAITLVWNIFAWKFSIKKNRFWTTDYTIYVCDDYVRNCDSLIAKYTIWVVINDLFWTTYYICKWWLLECNNYNAIYTFTTNN